MNFIKVKLFLLLFSILSISASNNYSETETIILDEVIIEDFYKTNQNLMYAKNFKEYKKNVSIIISMITKDI